MGFILYVLYKRFKRKLLLIPHYVIVVENGDGKITFFPVNKISDHIKRYLDMMDMTLLEPRVPSLSAIFHN